VRKTLKESNKLALLIMLVSLTGMVTVSSTFAWYQIQVNANALYDGTSIGNSTKFQIGLKSDVTLSGYESYRLEKDTTNSNIYWSNGDLSSDTLKYYLLSNGYATNVLYGSTSGGYVGGSDLTLKSSPTYLLNTSNTKADKNSYAHFAFVFRVINLKDDSIITNANIYLKEFSLNGENAVYSTMRIFSSSEAFKGIINLNSINNGSNNMAGRLDLNGDGYYDYMSSANSNGNIINKEFIYGDYNNLDYSSIPSVGGTPNYNGNSFQGATYDGVYSALYTASSAQYYGTDAIIENKQVLTSVSNNKYAELGFTIYLEGWDLNFIDNISNRKFALSLSFESD